MKNPVLILLIVLITIALCQASSGDYQPEYIQCVELCTANTDISQLPLYLRLLQWTVKQDCGYHCMQRITQEAVVSHGHIHQYHGKWPFQRVFGIQEPASVIFSILNGLMHYKYFYKIRQHIPDDYPLKKLYLGISVVGMNAWLWSTIFHTRDVPATEKLDYFSAGLYILYSFYMVVLRVFYVRGTAAVVWTCICAAMYIFHVTYLSNLERFDYGYNMLACIVIGAAQTNIWLIWSIAQYTPYGVKARRPFAWMAGLSVILIACAMGLEVFDFSPYLETFDAHSLWHAATIPLVPLFYRFILRDTELEYTHPSTQIAKDKRSS